jgi:acetyl-CoA carboxylase biotin carboxyl carrier protein
VIDLDLRRLRALLRTLADADVSEFEFEDEAVRLRIRIGEPPMVEAAIRAPRAAAHAGAPISGRAVPVAGRAEPDVEASGVVVLTSPFVGTFYRAPAPDAPPFVEVGDTVRPGQTLCIVEAMKLMNEIEAECAGQVLEILAENGKPVEYAQPLFRIRKA